MANLAFELGFDWNTHPVIGVRDGVYPLQVCLVRDARGEEPAAVISPCNPAEVKAEDELEFRVYDFTDYSPYKDRPPAPRPMALQVLFTSGSEGQTVFSPVIQPPGEVLPVLTSVSFDLDRAPKSIAYGVSIGWTVEWSNTTEVVTLGSLGRFKFRALLTVGVPNDMARFYRVDPEMVVGASDPGWP